MLHLPDAIHNTLVAHAKSSSGFWPCECILGKSVFIISLLHWKHDYFISLFWSVEVSGAGAKESEEKAQKNNFCLLSNCVTCLLSYALSFKLGDVEDTNEFSWEVWWTLKNLVNYFNV